MSIYYAINLYIFHFYGLLVICILDLLQLRINKIICHKKKNFENKELIYFSFLNILIKLLMVD